MAGNAAAPDRELSQPREEAAELPTESANPATAADPIADAADTEPGQASGRTADIDSAIDRGVDSATPAKKRITTQRVTLLIGLAILLALAGLTGWLEVRAHDSRTASEQRELFLQTARQGAINLTTIDFTHADTDVQRILDSATGTFHDDFSRRSQPFVDVVKQAQTKSVGTVTAAGLESDSGDEAQALVAVTVKTSNAGAAEQPPRVWRMRISVDKVGDQVKLSNVGFVP
jgi:Mce-associated membrane protein